MIFQHNIMKNQLKEKHKLKQKYSKKQIEKFQKAVKELFKKATIEFTHNNFEELKSNLLHLYRDI